MGDQPPDEEKKITLASMIDASFQLAKRLVVLKNGASALIVFAAAPLAIVVDLYLAPVVQPALGAVAVGLFIFHANNSFRTRPRLEHWDIPGIACQLRQEIVLGCLTPALIAAIAFLLPASWEALSAICILLAANYHLYELVEEAIFLAVKNSPKTQGSEDFVDRQPFGWLGITDSNGDGSEKKRTPGFWTVIRFFLRPPSRDNLSWTRTVLVWIMFGAFVLAGAAAAQDGARGSRDHDTTEESSVVEQQQGASSFADDSDVEVPGTNQPTEDEKQTDCLSEPGDGAPKWAKSDIYRLYRGPRLPNATRPPGTANDIGGCPSAVFTIATPHGPFAYVVGSNRDEEVRSVAVVSRAFDPQVFLAPAAKRVLELIHQGSVPLGGFKARDVATGEMASIATIEGTILLIRSEQTLPGKPEFAAPFVELPVAVSAAWAAAVRSRRQWLWPLPPEPDSDSLIYPLTSRSDGIGERVNIIYDPRTGSAVRDGYVYPSSQAQLDPEDLAAFARLAR